MTSSELSNSIRTDATTAAHLGDAIDRALATLARLQRNDGHFRGELEGDSILQSEYLLMKFILGQEDEPMANGAPGRPTLDRIARMLRAQQRPDGGWGQFPGSDVDLSATVKAYLALKLLGDDPAAAPMLSAREIVRRMGGAEDCNSFTNFFLACLGQIPFDAVPAIPPEIVYLPSWFPFHMSKVSAWTRTMILPLAIVSALRPVRELDPAKHIDELFVDERLRRQLTSSAPPSFWSRTFLALDAALKSGERLGVMPLRRVAIERAERWVLDRTGQDGAAATNGLGAIFPPMVYIQIVLKALGYARDHPIVRRAERELDALFIEDGDRIRIQPCFSPVWDTGIALYAMNDAGLDEDDPAAARAADWLRSKECTHRGDWADGAASETPAAAWFFEYENAWYPDADDTAMVAMALLRTGGAMNRRAARRGIAWILAMQNDDGGWAAFDRTKPRPILECVPFADHNAMQDPSCPDITGRVLECLATDGRRVGHDAVDRAIAYIRSRQEPEGCFFGRWGVNYIYGTWQSIVGPLRCGVSPDEPWIARAGAWLKSVQKDDGSFGESALSYEDPSLKGQGPSTASQTAWAAMSMLEIFGAEDDDVTRAMMWLIDAQLDERDAADHDANRDGDPAGSWVETEFTGTGFPRVFYLRYHLYRLYFPLMALARWRARLEA